MTTPINLTELRAWAERTANQRESTYPEAVLALIATTEAALTTVASATGDPNATTVTIEGTHFDRLCETLTRYTTS